MISMVATFVFYQFLEAIFILLRAFKFGHWKKMLPELIIKPYLKQNMTTYKTILSLFLFILTFNACGLLNDKLTEEEAKNAGAYMLTLKNQEPGNGDKIKFIKWNGFIESGDNKAELWGVFQSQNDSTCVMSGAFNFMKPKDGDWSLTSYYFHGEVGTTCIWSKDFARYKIPD
jgi:hypothetical protein